MVLHGEGGGGGARGRAGHCEGSGLSNEGGSVGEDDTTHALPKAKLIRPDTRNANANHGVGRTASFSFEDLLMYCMYLNHPFFLAHGCVLSFHTRRCFHSTWVHPD